MRNVLKSNAEAIHFFANDVQESGRNSTHSIFFNKDKIYSYGYHYLLGQNLKGGAIIINDRGYSNSTSKHIGMLGSGTRHKTQFYATEVILEDVYNTINFNLKKIPRARQNKFYYINGIKNVFEKMLNFQKYLKIHKFDRFERFIDFNNKFGQTNLIIDKRSVKFKECKRIYDKLITDLPNLEKEVLKQNKKDLIARQKKEKVLITKFRNNKLSNCRLTYDIFRLNCNLDGVYSVYSNQGIKIDLEEAKRSLKMLFSYVDYLKIKNVHTDQLMDVSLVGKKIGYYTITSFDGKLLKVGCHTIKLSELKHINKLITNLTIN